MTETAAAIRIVPMAEAHIPAIAEIERLSFSVPWSEELLIPELSNPTAFFFAALCDGLAAGYVGTHCVLDECYIANIAVHPDFRRRGIAVALLARLDALAEEKKLAFITLEVRESNLAAIRLYEKSGYKFAGKRKAFYSSPREDGVIMTKYFE